MCTMDILLRSVYMIKYNGEVDKNCLTHKLTYVEDKAGCAR